MASNAPAAPEDLGSALGQAREELAKESSAAEEGAAGGTEETPVKDDKATETAEAKTAAAAEAKPATEDAATFVEKVTAEEMAIIQADPKLLKAYNSMLADYRTKTANAADVVRKAEAASSDEDNRKARALYDAMRDNPEAVIRALAQRRGMTVAEAKKEVKEVETDEELVELFGEEHAKDIAPAFNKALDKRMDARMKPVFDYINAEQERVQKGNIALAAREVASELKADGKEITPEIETEMVRLSKTIDAAEGTSYKDYMKYLYAIATSGKDAAVVTKEVVNRMEAAAKDKEPASVPTGGNVSEAEIPEGTPLREALEIARKRLK